MIVPIMSLLFYVIDPFIGIILALVLPVSISLDTNGDYAEIVITFLFASAMAFVRKLSTDREE